MASQSQRGDGDAYTKGAALPPPSLKAVGLRAADAMIIDFAC